MNWLAKYMGVEHAAPAVEEDDDAPVTHEPKSVKKAAPKLAEPEHHRGYNWRNRHGQREVGELRP